MGTQFSLIYDLVVGAVLLGMLLSGMKRGFASALVGLAAIFVAFICAITISSPLSEMIYTSFVQPSLDEAVAEAADDILDNVTLSELTELDFSRILVDGSSIEDIETEFSNSNSVTYDLSDVDLSKTGIADIDLTSIGIDADIDYTSLNGKTAEFSRSDIDRYGLGKMIVAQIISVQISDSEFIEAFDRFVGRLSENVPAFVESFYNGLHNGEISAVRKVILIMMTSKHTAKQAVIDGIIRPCFLIVTRTVIFCFIFFAVTILLSLIAYSLKIVNKIPLIGGVNVLAGGIVGLVQGIITVFVICIIVRVITVLSGGDVMFFNTATIDSTYVFKLFYDYKLFDLIN